MLYYYFCIAFNCSFHFVCLFLYEYEKPIEACVCTIEIFCVCACYRQGSAPVMRLQWWL